MKPCGPFVERREPAVVSDLHLPFRFWGECWKLESRAVNGGKCGFEKMCFPGSLCTTCEGYHELFVSVVDYGAAGVVKWNCHCCWIVRE